MSRKREKQRGDRRELARQLDVDADDVPDDLLAHGRVSEPELEPALTKLDVKRGLFKKAKDLHVDVALYVVDGSGTRLARHGRFHAPPHKDSDTGPIVLTLLALPAPPTSSTSSSTSSTSALPAAEGKVRYTRPGHFVVVAVVSEGSVDGGAATSALLAEPAGVRVDLDGAERAIAELRHVHVARGARVVGAGDGASFVAGGVVALAAVHRVQTVIDVPLSGDRIAATMSLKLRL